MLQECQIFFHTCGSAVCIFLSDAPFWDLVSAQSAKLQCLDAQVGSYLVNLDLELNCL